MSSPLSRAIGLAALALSTLAGCGSTVGVRVTEELAAVRLSDLRSMVEGARPTEALEAVGVLGRVGGVEAAELEAMRGEAIRLLEKDLASALAGGSWERASSIAASLRAAGEAPTASGRDWNEAEILREAARASAAKGPAVLAAHYGFRLGALVGIAAVSPEDRGRFLRLLEDLKDPAAREEVLRLSAAAGVAVEGAADRPSAGSLPLSGPIVGTVTVLVDKGLRVKNRVGTPERVLGSGFFLDPSGYIMTNYHVIASEVDPEYEGFSRLYVTRSDRPNERIPAKVVGYDELLDLAVLKAEVEAEYTFYPGLASGLRAGDQVLAIGSPVSLESSVNSGIVSAVGRRFLQLGDVMQIDVPVNPGNSGGPLLDAGRRVVGVVFAGLEQFEGLNFAIPATWIGRVFPRLFEGGQVRYAWMGAGVTKTDAGLEVVYALPGGPSARVGIREGDLLESVAGVPAGTLADVQGRLMELSPPVLVEVRWRRGEERHSALVSLDERPLSPIETALTKDTRERILFPLFGMKLEKLGQLFGKPRYVVRKVLPGSQAATIGLTADDPLSIESWRVDKKQKIAVLNMYITRKSSGYLEGIVQLAAYLEQDSFL